MFGRRKNYKRRSNPIFVIFRLFLSLIIFAVLLAGVYSAYKHFSGTDFINISPKAIISNFSSSEKITAFITSILSIGNNSKNVILGRTQSEAWRTTPESNVKDSGPFDGTQGSSRGFTPRGKQARMTNTDSTEPKPKGKSTVSFKFALIADSHNENSNLAKALNQARENKVQFVIGLGDYTEVGTLAELENAKAEFDKAGIRYFVTAGDHDLWDSREKDQKPTLNFNKFFGPSYQSFSFGNGRFIILDNSDNYSGLGQSQLDWLNSELKKEQSQDINVRFTLLHEPLYHPSSTRFMGKVTPKLQDEAKKIIHMLKDGGAKEVFSGDIHFFTRYIDPETSLSMTTVGALTSQRNTQEPRFALVTVYEDGTYEVEDVEVE